MRDRHTARAWVEGFATGVAVCGIALYAKRKYDNRPPRFIQDDGTVIPIE